MFNQPQDVYTADQNMGLVSQVVTSLTRASIRCGLIIIVVMFTIFIVFRRLTRTFITLSLADLATRVGLANPQQVGHRQ